MNPVMKITIEVAINVSTEDDTAAASEHSDLGIHSWTLFVYTDAKLQYNVCMYAYYYNNNNVYHNGRLLILYYYFYYKSSSH